MSGSWTGVCTRRQLIPERGVAVLIHELQVALFRITGVDDAGAETDFVYAVGHKDPACGANVMARGIVGSVITPQGHRDTVASPMYKDVYDLSTGECLTRPELRLPVYRTWVAGGVVYVDVNAPVLASA
ncbi:MAG: nitrite reductase (NAD(P)H) small subunit [Nocardioidaceae bacterium]|jgi:nitrite reductase (NADH) small subunit